MKEILVLVFAAASLTDALKEIAASWEIASGEGIAFNFAASSLLARQIREGAPADLFLSADEAQMDGLERAGFVVPGTRRSVLSNTLVAVIPLDSALRIASARDLAGKGVERLALAEPTSVPAGVYAKKFFERAGIWDALAPKVVPTENARATLAAVESGNVDAGIVYRTDAAISKRVRIAFEIPVAMGPSISYPFALVMGAPRETEARRFLAYLGSPAARAVFVRCGFLVKD
ncbi:MAG: molybdate ABC transporter substrate-binding protein [Thermoanaerobaculia bacterium]